MDTSLEIRKESEVDPIDKPLCSNGCKVGTLLFAGSMIIIAGIIVGVSVGLAK